MTSLIIGIACAASSAVTYAQDLLSTYELAKANDPVVLKAEAQFNASKEDIVQARSALLPSLDGSGSYTLHNVTKIRGGDKTSDSDGFSLSLDFGMSLYKHDNWLRLDNAKKSAHQADLSYQAAKQDLITRVTEAYFNVLQAKDDLEFAEAEKAAIERQLEQTRQRHSVGLTAVTAVLEAQAEFDNALTQVIRSENAVFNAEEALRVITNVYPRDLKVLNTEKFSVSRPSPDSANEWQQTAEAKNLDLIIQKIGVDIAKENINIARSGHYPSLSLGGSISRSDNENNFTDITSKTQSESLGITLKVPLYSGGAITSSVRKAQSNFVSASQDLQRTHRDVVRNARNSYNTVIAAVSAIKALEQSVISAESALKATEAGFEVGTRTIVDVLNSTRNLYNAKRNLSSTRYNYIQAILNLKRAGGTISEADVQAINQGLKDAS